MYIKKLKIGNVELENNLILAPMAGVTDLPFRVLCKEQGAGIVCTEMASSRAIFHNDEKTKQLIDTTGEKRPISYQIFGSDEESMGYSAKEFSNFAEIIDINMGCPAPKVVKNGDGSKLLLDLEKAESIIKAVVQNSTVPVTLKIRKGWDKEHIVAVELAKIAEKCGISAITVHGRTRTEFFSGNVDLEIIKKVKEAVNIPVIGNGNIVDEESALEMFKKTGVDGIMIGRGSLGNPWIFRNIKHFLETGEKLPMPTPEERQKAMKRHIELAIANKGEQVAIHEIRKHVSWYTKNLPNASEFRNLVNHTENSESLLQLIDKYFNDLIINNIF